jgi:hypothetical protein
MFFFNFFYWRTLEAFQPTFSYTVYNDLGPHLCGSDLGQRTTRSPHAHQGHVVNGDDILTLRKRGICALMFPFAF